MDSTMFDDLEMEILGKSSKKEDYSDFSLLPFRVILIITSEFYSLHLSSDIVIDWKLFYGRFLKDPTKSTFLVFSCYIISDCTIRGVELQISRYLPLEVRAICFEDVTCVPTKYFEKYKYIESIERIKVESPHIFSRMNVPNLRRISFDMDLRNDVLEKLQSFHNLRELKIDFWKLESKFFDCDITNRKLKCLTLSSNNVYNFWPLPPSITFSQLRLNKIIISHVTISNDQILNLSAMKTLQEVSLDECELPQSDCYAFKCFELPRLQKISLSFCEFEVRCLMNILFGNDSPVREIRLCQVSDIPKPFLEKLLYRKNLRYLNFICCDADDIQLFLDLCLERENQWDGIVEADIGSTMSVKNETLQLLKSKNLHVCVD